MDLEAFRRDERGIVTGWIVRIVVGLALLGVVLFDAGAIVVNYFSVDSAADEVALDVVARIGSGEEVIPNRECMRRAVDSTCRAVYDVAREKDIRIVSARFDADGVFHVTARRTADTLLVGRIGAIEDWATATASAQADTN